MRSNHRSLVRKIASMKKSQPKTKPPPSPPSIISPKTRLNGITKKKKTNENRIVHQKRNAAHSHIPKYEMRIYTLASPPSCLDAEIIVKFDLFPGNNMIDVIADAILQKKPYFPENTSSVMIKLKDFFCYASHLFNYERFNNIITRRSSVPDSMDLHLKIFHLDKH